MSGERMAMIIAAAYALVALVTFGHAAAASDKSIDQELAQCEAARKEYCYNGRIAGLEGALSALVWPLYWSWELQS